jgi:hypothetical protein
MGGNGRRQSSDGDTRDMTCQELLVAANQQFQAWFLFISEVNDEG